ncbi:unnamed protein product [Rangifer tarandus platyrhynchus]|uniref:Uncharacterized protein n=1 Tax=Rangifer tarandus platyrhynchus TaxID=3082113 RepID=A0AC60A1I6_RANTA
MPADPGPAHLAGRPPAPRPRLTSPPFTHLQSLLRAPTWCKLLMGSAESGPWSVGAGDSLQEQPLTAALARPPHGGAQSALAGCCQPKTLLGFLN